MTEEDSELENKLKSIKKYDGGGDSLAPESLKAKEKKNKIEDRVLYKTEDQITFSKEINLREVKKNKQDETSKISHTEKEISSEKENNDESRKQDSNTTKNNLSIGNQLYRLISWSINASYSYEMTSSSNYLNQLSKQLTK